MRVDRLNLMEEYILQHGIISIPDLSSKFNISVNTVRRDLKTILNRGRITKVYGGVASVNGIEIPMSDRAGKHDVEKRHIGELAATLVNNHSTIFLDAGSTTPNILPYLSNKEDVTIVTHSLIALYEASKYPNLNIIDLGGVYNHSTASFVGFSTIEVLSRISVKLIFIAATGVSLEHGLTNSTYFEAELKHHLSQRSAQIVLMADHSKFGYSAAVSFLDFSDLDAIVTDSPIPPSFMDAVRKDNIQLLIYNDSK